MVWAGGLALADSDQVVDEFVAAVVVAAAAL